MRDTGESLAVSTETPENGVRVSRAIEAYKRIIPGEVGNFEHVHLGEPLAEGIEIALKEKENGAAFSDIIKGRQDVE